MMVSPISATAESTMIWRARVLVRWAFRLRWVFRLRGVGRCRVRGGRVFAIGTDDP